MAATLGMLLKLILTQFLLQILQNLLWLENCVDRNLKYSLLMLVLMLSVLGIESYHVSFSSSAFQFLLLLLEDKTGGVAVILESFTVELLF